MDIDRDARVMASDGEVGRVKHVVVDGQTREVTDLVVDDGGNETLIPIAEVASADGKTVRLRGSRAQLRSAGMFNRDEFRGVDDDTAREESMGTARRGGAPLRDASDDSVAIDPARGTTGAAAMGGQTVAPRRQEQTVREQPVMREQTTRQQPVMREQTTRQQPVMREQTTRQQPAASAQTARAQTARGDEMVVPVAEEHLYVTKRQAEVGAVEVRKTVETEQVSVPVELRREEVRVQEVDVADRPLQAGEDAFQGGTIRVPVRGEEAVVQKEAVITGEVVIDKGQTTERQQVSDTVRKEQVEVQENVVQPETTRTETRERRTRQ
jgi:uncharacterized protein (TIGR02271 family)